MEIVAIIQARLTSERLPEKVLKQVGEKPIIKSIVERINQSKRISKVIIATSDEKSDDKLYNFCMSENLPVFRGELNNVLKRYYDCATQNRAQIIIRLTGDNALVDSYIVDKAIDVFFQNQDLDYLHYCKELPLGMAVEVFTYTALKQAYLNAVDAECKEHVTLYMYKNVSEFNCLLYSDSTLQDHSNLRWTVDTKEDYELVKSIYHYFGEKQFHYEDILNAYECNPSWNEINSAVQQKKINYKGEE